MIPSAKFPKAGELDGREAIRNGVLDAPHGDTKDLSSCVTQRLAQRRRTADLPKRSVALGSQTTKPIVTDALMIWKDWKDFGRSSFWSSGSPCFLTGVSAKGHQRILTFTSNPTPINKGVPKKKNVVARGQFSL